MCVAAHFNAPLVITCAALLVPQGLMQLQQQLRSSQAKVQQLTRARDKLQALLHDFEAAAAEEKAQLLQQLSAASAASQQQQLSGNVISSISEVGALRLWSVTWQCDTHVGGGWQGGRAS